MLPLPRCSVKVNDTASPEERKSMLETTARFSSLGYIRSNVNCYSICFSNSLAQQENAEGADHTGQTDPENSIDDFEAGQGFIQTVSTNRRIMRSDHWRQLWDFITASPKRCFRRVISWCVDIIAFGSSAGGKSESCFIKPSNNGPVFLFYVDK